MQKKLLLILIVIFLLVSLGGFVYYQRDIFEKTNFTGTFEIINPSKIAMDNQQDKYIIDNSMRRIVKLSKDNKVSFIINGGNRNENSFFNAVDLALDDEGNLYILETVFSENTEYVEKQRILKYSSTGHFDKTLYVQKYAVEEHLGEGRIVSLKYIDGKIYGFFRDDSQYTLISIHKDTGEFNKVNSFSYDNPQRNIIDFDFTEDFKNIVFITKKGEIWHQAELLSLITSDMARKDLFVPLKVKIDEQRNIYFSDVGARTIEKIDFLTKKSELMIKDATQIITSFDINNGTLTAIGEDHIIISDNGKEIILKNNSIGLEPQILIIRIMFWISLLIILILTVYLVRFIYPRFLKGKVSTVFIQSSVIVIFIFITAMIVANFMNNSFTTKYKEDLSSQLKLIAYLSSGEIDTQAILGINKRSDYMNEDYEKLYNQLHQLFNQNEDEWNNKFYGEIYTIRDNKIYALMYYDDTGGTYLPYHDNFAETNIYSAVTNKQICSGTIKDIYGEWIYAVAPLLNSKGDVIAILSVGTDLNSFAENNRKLIQGILLEVITLLVILVLSLIELTIFRSLMDRNLPEAKIKDNKLLMIRPLAFILTIGYNLSLSFVPLLTEKLYVPILNIPESVVLGLPISFEMLCVAIASVISGYIADKKGWRSLFIGGSIIIAFSSIISAVAWEPICFIISRGICGFGYGLVLIAVHVFTSTDNDELKQNKSLSYLTAGAFAGLSCGTAIGGMLADQIGFSNVFYIIAIIVIGAALFAYKLMDNTIPVKGTEEVVYTKKIAHFFKDINVLSFFLFLFLPASICAMFLIYFFPTFAEASGYTSTDSSRIFMLYGICIIYIGPMLTKFVSKYFGSKISSILYVLIILGGLGYFALEGTISSAIVAVIALAIAESFGLIVAINYFVGLRASKELGKGMALGFFGLVENIGQMLGPLIFGMLLIFGNTKGVGILTISSAGLLLAFVILSKKNIINSPLGRLGANQNNRPF